MSLDDLRDAGILLPEEEWGEHRLQTTVRQVPLGITFLVAAGSLALMFLGDGSALTWVGAGAFLACLYTLTLICDRAVVQQRRRTARERRAAR